MNRQDRARLDTIVAQANTLMDAPPRLNPRVRNTDVIEALIADVGLVSADRPPRELSRLIEIDAQDLKEPHHDQS